MRSTRGGMFVALILVPLIYLTVNYANNTIPIHHSLMSSINNKNAQDSSTEVKDAPELNWTDHVDGLPQVKQTKTTLPASYSRNKTGPLSLQKDTYSFGPYSGEYFENACKHSKEKIIECSKLQSRLLTPLEVSGGDILFTVRTTAKYHAARLPDILDTWLSSADPKSVYIISDGRDEDLEKKLGILGQVSNYHKATFDYIFCACKLEAF